MIQVLFIVITLVSGYIVSAVIDEKSTLCERVGLTLFFGISLPAFVGINIALLCKVFLSGLMVFGVGLSVLAAASLLLVIKYKERAVSVLIPTSRTHVFYTSAILTVFAAAVTGYALLYSNLQFILSLGSYILKGEAECFYMQTFKTFGLLNPLLNRYDMPHEFYRIICTPGNSMFTSFFLPILKMNTFLFLTVACDYILN